MLFSSLTFLVFFAVFYALYLSMMRRKTLQNGLLLIASYIFYGYWDWRFLLLIAISTLADYLIGLAMGRLLDAPEHAHRRRVLLAASISVNLGILGFFKYFNFFADSFTELLDLFGMSADPVTLNIVLPVGISFYTFQTLSYTIDIYRGRLKPTHNLLDFAVFVAFFPQLVAGPIERAARFLPQVQRPRTLRPDMISAGLFLIVWGYFKKVCVADNAGVIADQIFNNYTDYQGLDLALGVLAFTIQIYGDFSAYSDIARGLSRLMGFELMVNFRLPYFALNPSDFWQRWHISLSTWLRDYLYIPLGGNRKGEYQTYRNLSITMLLGGLWHGASWNFVLWGGYQGLILVLYRLFERRPIHQDPWHSGRPVVEVLGRMLLMLILVMIGWLFFRAHSLEQILYMLTEVSLVPSAASAGFIAKLMVIITPLLLVEICQYRSRDLLIMTKLALPVRLGFYSALLIMTVVFGADRSMEFIYFQF